ncbi:hypothetical protein CSC88_27025, partial [Klebsiella pneumoniae]
QQEIETVKAAGQEAWPTDPFRDIDDETVRDEQRAAIMRRGCEVMEVHFQREQALAGDREMREDTDRKHFDDVDKGAGDRRIGTLGSSRTQSLPIQRVLTA